MQSLMDGISNLDDDTIKECFTNLILAGIYKIEYVMKLKIYKLLLVKKSTDSSYYLLLSLGVDTTATALTCLILTLLHNQEIQTKIQEEIDSVFPDGVFPSLSGRPQTPYTEAVILELLRFISHVPLAVPHSTLKNASIGGYHIDSDSTVLVIFVVVLIQFPQYIRPCSVTKK